MSDQDVTEIKVMLKKIIAALYGKAGELNGAGIGLVSRVDKHNDRLDKLEKANTTAGNRAWDLAKFVLSPLIAAFVAVALALKVVK